MKEEPKQVIKCYCGHTTTCDCGGKEETLEEFNQRTMKTIAQQLNIKEFPFKIKDKNGKEIYHEESAGFWTKREYDSNGNEISYENSAGVWDKYEYDSNGNKIYFEDSSRCWEKYEYDSNGNIIYYENSKGYITDNRPNYEGKIVEIEGKKYKLTAV